MTKYGKKILAYKEVILNGEYCDVYCLDGGEYYDIHIIHDSFMDEEMNTLHLQEPKQLYKDIPDDVALMCWGVEFLLWYKFSNRNNKLYSFDINYFCEDME